MSVGTTAEAFREVLLSNDFTQSSEREAFDSADGAGRLHKQFYIMGPRLTELLPAFRVSHLTWEMDIVFAWLPQSGDVDRGRFDAMDQVSELTELWGENTTIKGDGFNVLSANPEWIEELAAWAIPVVVVFRTSREWT